MLTNFIVCCIGLIICFGGIYFKRIVSTVTGVAWGGCLGIILTLISAATLHDVDKKILIYSLIGALSVGILCAVYSRLCTIIISFSTIFVICLILLAFSPLSEVIVIIILISALIAGVIAYIAYLFDEIAFILSTAFSGAFIANIGGAGLIMHIELSEFLGRMLSRNSNSLSWISLGTVILGIIGCFIQSQRGKWNRTGFNWNTFDTSMLTNCIRTLINTLKSVVPRNLNTCIIIIPCLAYLIFPCILNHFYWEQNILLIILQAKNSLVLLSIGGLIYLVITQDLKKILIYQLPYLVVQIMRFTTKYTTIGGFYKFFEMTRFAITGLSLYYLSKTILKNKDKEAIVLTGIAYLLYYVAIPFLSGKSSGAGYSFYITRHIIPFIVLYMMVYALFIFCKKENIFIPLSQIEYGTIVDKTKDCAKKCWNNTVSGLNKDKYKKIGLASIVIVLIGGGIVYITIFRTPKVMLDYTNLIVKEIVSTGAYKLEPQQTYTLDLDCDGKEESISFMVEFFKAWGHKAFFYINEDMFILDYFGEEWPEDAYTTNAYYSEAVLKLNANNEIIIVVTIPENYGYEECELKYDKNTLKGEGVSIEIR